MRRLTLGLLLGLLPVLLGPPREGAWALERGKRIAAMKGVVLLLTLRRQEGRLVPTGNGSGSVISPDGLILTNNHVVADIASGQLHDAIGVLLTTSFDRTPRPVCIAFPAHAVRDPALDLAVVKCEAELNGQPFRRGLRWPTVQVGDSSEIVPGDDIYIVGYPAIGGSTITFSAGKASGFLDDRGVARAWIKTDAMVAGGVSGGAAFDETGKLIGVPTATFVMREREQSRIGFVRPIERAKALLARAKATEWTSRPRLDSTGEERGARGSTASTGSYIEGQVVDAETGSGISGALVLVMKPGVLVDSLTRATLRSRAAAIGIARNLGFFRTQEAVAQGQAYGIVVLAKGYKPLGVDGAIRVKRGGPEVHEVGVIRLRASSY